MEDYTALPGALAAEARENRFSRVAGAPIIVVPRAVFVARQRQRRGRLRPPTPFRGGRASTPRRVGRGPDGAFDPARRDRPSADIGGPESATYRPPIKAQVLRARSTLAYGRLVETTSRSTPSATDASAPPPSTSPIQSRFHRSIYSGRHRTSHHSPHHRGDRALPRPRLPHLAGEQLRRYAAGELLVNIRGGELGRSER
jgi:hypothetical protein